MTAITQAREALAATYRVYSAREWRKIVADLLTEIELTEKTRAAEDKE